MKKPVIGVPRGLFYYRYFPFWKTFFAELGTEGVVSPPTDKKILDYGLRCLTDEICLPVKAFCGQAASLKGKCDFVLIPSIYISRLKKQQNQELQRHFAQSLRHKNDFKGYSNENAP